MAYRIAAVSMTLGDFQGHSPIAGLFKGHFRAVPLRQMSVLYIGLP